MNSSPGTTGYTLHIVAWNGGNAANAPRWRDYAVIPVITTDDYAILLADPQRWPLIAQSLRILYGLRDDGIPRDGVWSDRTGYSVLIRRGQLVASQLSLGEQFDAYQERSELPPARAGFQQLWLPLGR